MLITLILNLMYIDRNAHYKIACHLASDRSVVDL